MVVAGDERHRPRHLGGVHAPGRAHGAGAGRTHRTPLGPSAGPRHPHREPGAEVGVVGEAAAREHDAAVGADRGGPVGPDHLDPGDAIRVVGHHTGDPVPQQDLDPPPVACVLEAPDELLTGAGLTAGQARDGEVRPLRDVLGEIRHVVREVREVESGDGADLFEALEDGAGVVVERGLEVVLPGRQTEGRVVRVEAVGAGGPCIEAEEGVPRILDPELPHVPVVRDPPASLPLAAGPAPDLALLQDHHVRRAGLPGADRRHEPGRPGADDDDVRRPVPAPRTTPHRHGIASSSSSLRWVRHGVAADRARVRCPRAVPRVHDVSAATQQR